MTNALKPNYDAEWDKELHLLWKRSGLPVHYLWMAELKMNLFGRHKAYEWLKGEAKDILRTRQGGLTDVE